MCEVVSYSLSGVLGARNKSGVHPPASALPPAGKRCANPILDLIPLISLFLHQLVYLCISLFIAFAIWISILISFSVDKKKEKRKTDVEET